MLLKYSKNNEGQTSIFKTPMCLFILFVLKLIKISRPKHVIKWFTPTACQLKLRKLTLVVHPQRPWHVFKNCGPIRGWLVILSATDCCGFPHPKLSSYPVRCESSKTLACLKTAEPMGISPKWVWVTCWLILLFFEKEWCENLIIIEKIKPWYQCFS